MSGSVGAKSTLKIPGLIISKIFDSSSKQQLYSRELLIYASDENALSPHVDGIKFRSISIYVDRERISSHITSHLRHQDVRGDGEDDSKQVHKM